MTYPTIDMQATGERLQTIMKEKNISAKRLQSYLGLSCVQSVYHWLDGRSLPTVDHLYAMSELFQIPIDEMLCGTRNSLARSRKNCCYGHLCEYYIRIQELRAA